VLGVPPVGDTIPVLDVPPLLVLSLPPLLPPLPLPLPLPPLPQMG